MNTPSLIARCIARDGAAWTELVSTHRALILRVLVRTVGSAVAPALDDLEQEVWSRLFANDCEALRGLVDAEPPVIRAFLYRTALNIGRDHRRRLAVRSVHQDSLDELEVEAPDQDEGLESLYERHERMQVVFQALEEVLVAPYVERDRMIFRAHYVDGMTASEIAAMGVDLAPKGVETLLLRLVKRVRSLLQAKKDDAA